MAEQAGEQQGTQAYNIGRLCAYTGGLPESVPGCTEEQNLDVAKAYVKGNRDSFYQDVVIWKHKVRIDKPVLAETDGPVYQLREWYEQFFTDEDLIPASMAERREIITVDER